MNAPALALLLLATVASQAQGAERDWIMSGAELAEALQGKAGQGVSGEEGRRLSSARAHAYIAGVADAAGGRGWCSAGSVPPHELADRVHTYLVDLPPSRLSESAARLVMEALGKSFPCR
ncbi:hypothetical protein IAI18_05475 [Acetobacteraceae bacterium H6797]|nr:hypothetical protein [Acetobacteraceae bacterium H6797]